SVVDDDLERARADAEEPGDHPGPEHERATRVSARRAVLDVLAGRLVVVATFQLEPAGEVVLLRDRLPGRAVLGPQSRPRGEEHDAEEQVERPLAGRDRDPGDRKSTRLNSSHQISSYAVFS